MYGNYRVIGYDKFGTVRMIVENSCDILLLKSSCKFD